MKLAAGQTVRPALVLAGLAMPYAGLLGFALLPGGLRHSTIVISVALAAALVALSFIDLATMRLPDAITLPMIPAGIGLNSLAGIGDPLWTVLWHGLGAAVGFGALAALASSYRHLRGHAGLGLGDAKLMAVAGAWLGVEGLATVVAYAAGAALASVAIAAAFGYRLSRFTRIPFGPFLALAIWLVWLFGPLQ